MISIQTKNQTKKEVKEDRVAGFKYTVKLRFDDQRRNGHNTFTITCNTDEWRRNRWRAYSYGCNHETVAKQFPHFAKYLKWHLTSTDGPIHYIANTLYHASIINEKHHFVYLDKSEIHDSILIGLYDDNKLATVKEYFKDFSITIKSEATCKCPAPNIEFARSTAIWPDATLKQLRSKKQLEARLPKLLSSFQDAMEELGFIY